MSHQSEVEQVLTENYKEETEEIERKEGNSGFDKEAEAEPTDYADSEIKEKKPKIKETIEEIKQNQPIVAYIIEKFNAKIIN